MQVETSDGNVATDVKDIGIYGEYDDTKDKYTDFVRDVATVNLTISVLKIIMFHAVRQQLH